MKIRLYTKDHSKLIQEQMFVGVDSNGGYYMIDVEHICPHEEESRELLEQISWNNVDLKKEKERLTLRGSS